MIKSIPQWIFYILLNVFFWQALNQDPSAKFWTTPTVLMGVLLIVMVIYAGFIHVISQNNLNYPLKLMNLTWMVGIGIIIFSGYTLYYDLYLMPNNGLILSYSTFMSGSGIIFAILLLRMSLLVYLD